MDVSNRYIHRAKKRKHKHKDRTEKDEKKRLIVDEDALKHGGWWRVTKFEQIIGSVAIQFGNKSYVKCLDNGLFTLGAPHDDGDPPAPEEIFTAIAINEKQIVFKSGYGRYLKVEKDGVITGRSEAIGALEQFEPVFQVGTAKFIEIKSILLNFIFSYFRKVKWPCKQLTVVSLPLILKMMHSLHFVNQ